MLVERCLLTLKGAGPSLADVAAFWDKCEYVLSTIPAMEMQREPTFFNHFVDELERCTGGKNP